MTHPRSDFAEIPDFKDANRVALSRLASSETVFAFEVIPKLDLHPFMGKAT